ncbi:MAG: glycoside hydrolase family 92 protein [Clostridia bacterium]|nr:glycoside hydrolase family 92 protein [Clostridia bacterium]
MKDYTTHVNVFQGNGEIDLPKAEGIARSWYFIKAISGNTHPGAQLPFGKYSCCLHTKGYPTGYGINKVNCGGPIDYLHDELKFFGLAHFHQSGTGAINIYYNYALTSPAYGTTPCYDERPVLGEVAEPGYYSVKTEDILCEATVSEKAVLHRYTFEKPECNISIDFGHDGLYGKDPKEITKGKVMAISPNEIRAEMELRDIKWYFVAKCEDSDSSTVYDKDLNSAEVYEKTELNHDPVIGTFTFKNPGVKVLKLTTSNKSMEHAISLSENETSSFDEIKDNAHVVWNEFLSKIEIKTDDERLKEIFYSNLYHTLVKPSDFTGEPFLENYEEDETNPTPHIVDFSTMWDIYKTQLPLVFTLYPDITKKILETFRRFCEITNTYPHCYNLTNNLRTESNQACMLAEHAIADAYYRGIEADYKKLLELSEIDGSRFESEVRAPETCKRIAHLIDATCAFRTMANIASDFGMKDKEEKFLELANMYKGAYKNGLLKPDSDYYEGNLYNYSFRPTPECKERIAEYGKEFYKEELEKFFGYKNPEDVSSRFEGYNNESDIEAPAFCHYVDRNMYCEIIHAGIDYMFTRGRGGIPGNNDSGGLSSCYIWNVLGLFPISGFNTMICGSPRFEEATMHLPKADLVIKRKGEGIYTKKVTFNGKILENFELSVSEMMNGGELIFEMNEERV